MYLGKVELKAKSERKYAETKCLAKVENDWFGGTWMLKAARKGNLAKT